MRRATNQPTTVQPRKMFRSRIPVELCVCRSSRNDGGEEIEYAQKEQEVHRSLHTGSRSVTHSVAPEFRCSLMILANPARAGGLPRFLVDRCDHLRPAPKFHIAHPDVRAYTPQSPKITKEASWARSIWAAWFSAALLAGLLQIFWITWWMACGSGSALGRRHGFTWPSRVLVEHVDRVRFAGNRHRDRRRLALRGDSAPLRRGSEDGGPCWSGRLDY